MKLAAESSTEQKKGDLVMKNSLAIIWGAQAD